MLDKLQWKIRYKMSIVWVTAHWNILLRENEDSSPLYAFVLGMIVFPERCTLLWHKLYFSYNASTLPPSEVSWWSSVACGVQDVQLSSLTVSSLKSYGCLSWDPAIFSWCTCVKNDDNLCHGSICVELGYLKSLPLSGWSIERQELYRNGACAFKRRFLFLFLFFYSTSEN